MLKKIFLYSFIALALIFTCINTHFKSTEAALTSEFLRLHIIANSDSADDQMLKLKIRNRILSETKELFEPGHDIINAKEITADALDEFEAIAKKVIKENGCSYPVKASLSKSNFPTKEYGDLILPAGNYDALKIEIGKASGKNWWCVLFPPLCFVDESCVTANADEFQSLEKSIGKDNVSLISKDKPKSTQIKFKTYEIWQRSKHKLTALLSRNS